MPLRTALLALVLVPVLVAPARAEDKAVPAATQSAAVMVPSPVEDEAIAFRKLQSELMVATLSCKDARITAHYNIFVSRFRPALRDNARVLKAYFRRLYGSAGQHKLDDFITRLANEASNRQLAVSTAQLCQQSVPLEKLAASLDPRGFRRYAMAQAATAPGSHPRCAR